MIHYVYRKPHVRLAMHAYDTLGTIFMKKRAPKQFTEPKHICFIILHQIGDVVMSLPTIQAFHDLSPNAKLSIVTGSSPSPIVSNNPWQAETHVFDAAWNKVVQQLRSKPAQTNDTATELLTLINRINPDMAVIFFPDLKVNQTIGKTTIPRTLGFANAGGGFWLTDSIAMPEHGHQVERNLALAHRYAQLLQAPLENHTYTPQLTVTEADRSSLRTFLNAKHIPLDKLVVLHPFGSAITKNWLPERWAEVITWLNDHKHTPVIIGGPNDALSATTPETKAAIAQITSLCGQLSLRQSMALISQAKLFIGVDSGPGHIAAALGTPVISIFSSVNRPERYGPYGKNVTILHKPVKDRAAFPYELRDLPAGTEGNPYIDQITSADVIAVAEQTLETPATRVPQTARKTGPSRS